MAPVVDLNADIGEYADADAADRETALMRLVSSCSIACGGHTGDEATMRRTVQLAKESGVAVGAHPSYPDRDGFGRRSLRLDEAELGASIRKQINDLRMIAEQETVTLAYVKPHGALYNDAARNAALAALVVDACELFPIVGPPDSALEKAAKAKGLRFVCEGFVDRLYRRDGSLTPRSEPGAVIADIATRATQATSIALGKKFLAADGDLQLHVDTLCIHSDSEGAVETARAVRDALGAAGVTIAPFAPALS